MTPTSDGADVVVPSFRPDCVEEIDIIEEIARHHGYDALGKSVPKSAVHGRLSNMQQRRRVLRRVLVGLGLDEVMDAVLGGFRRGSAGTGLTVTERRPYADGSERATAIRAGAKGLELLVMQFPKDDDLPAQAAA